MSIVQRAFDKFKRKGKEVDEEEDKESGKILVKLNAGEKPKVSLGIKQLVPDPWDRIPYDYPAGKIVECKVLKVLDFGACVEIEMIAEVQ